MEVPGSIHQNAAKIDKSKHEINITNPYLTLKNEVKPMKSTEIKGIYLLQLF